MRAARIVAMTAGAALDHCGEKQYLYSKFHHHKNVFIMAQIIKGTEKKFSIELTAPGFSMDDDDFEIEVKTPSESLKGYKNPPAGAPTDVLVFKETAEVAGEGSDSSSSSSGTETGTWYAIVNTGAFTKTGEMTVVATAHIPDANANDGIRDEIVKAPLGTLVNP